METKISGNVRWRLKKIKEFWFLDVGGELKCLNMLTNLTDVFIEENIIFAGDIIYQLREESNGEIVISEVKNINQKDEASEFKQQDTIFMKKTSETSDIKYEADITEAKITLGTHIEDKTSQNVSFKRQKKVRNEELSLAAENNHSDDEEKVDPYTGSELYLRKEGKIRGFFKRFKQIIKKKPAETQVKDPIYEDSSSYFEDHLLEEENDKVNSPTDYCSDGVTGAKITTAIYDFEKFSDEDLSFKKLDKLKVRDDIISVNSDWCYAEHMSTGEKGFIPLAYVNQANQKLISEDWWHDVTSEASDELMNSLSTPRAGTYLIRPSDGHTFILSMLIPDNVTNAVIIRHYRIQSQKGQLFLFRRRVFSDIFALVSHHRQMADGLPCNLKYTIPKQRPVLYPRSIEVERNSIDFVRSFQIGKFGELFVGKFFKTFDVTIVTKCKSEMNYFLPEANILFEFRQSKHFVRMIAVVLTPEPFMIVLGETLQETLQAHLKKMAEKDVTLGKLTRMASEVAYGMAFLEEKGIVHGSLKSENVFICELTKLKIVHPNLIKLMKTSENDKHEEDEPGWQWTAPEVIADEQVLSTKSDVWSFGVVMYEIITFGEMPYADLEKERTTRALMNGFRLPLPRSGLIQCPVEYYNTVLQCWHTIPECRLTFDFLGDFLNDFNVSVESDNIFKDETLADIYMRGTIKSAPKLLNKLNDSVEHTFRDEGDVKLENQTDDCSSKTITVAHGDEISEQNVLENNGNLAISPGFDVIALYDYEAGDDDEISFNMGDIFTDIDPIDNVWWIGTTKNGDRGMFPVNYVEVCEGAYAEVTKFKE